MSTITFNNLKTIEDFCSFFEVSKKFLYFHLYVENGRRFKLDLIPKKSGGNREIYKPKLEWKHLLNKIKVELDKCYEPLPNVVGFIKNKSIVTGAQEHINKNFVVNLDLKDYFHSFNFKRVRGYFLGKPFNFNNSIATIIAKVVTYKNKLPMGSPCSPVIANMITYSLDKNFISYCKKFDITYTRYVDDLTFSSNHSTLNSNALVYKNNDKYKIKNVFIKIVENEGFEINESKTSIRLKEQRQQVTNLTVNNKVNVVRKYIRNIRGVLFIVKRDKNKMSADVLNKKFKQLYGKLSFLSMVVGKNDQKYLKYAQQFNEVFGKEHFDVDIYLNINSYIENRIVVIDTGIGNATGFVIKYEKSFYLITSTHSFVDGKGVQTVPNLQYFYLKEKRRKKTLPIIKITNENIYEDIIFFRIKDTELINEGRNKYFDLTKETMMPLGSKVTLAGYTEYDEANTTTHDLVETQIVGRRRVQEKDNCWRLNGRVLAKGMSGGPVINSGREVIGVNFLGAKLLYSYIRPFNLTIFKKLLDADYKMTNDIFQMGPVKNKIGWD